MKNFFFILLLVLGFTACQSDSSSSKTASKDVRPEVAMLSLMLHNQSPFFSQKEQDKLSDWWTKVDPKVKAQIKAQDCPVAVQFYIHRGSDYTLLHKEFRTLSDPLIGKQEKLPIDGYQYYHHWLADNEGEYITVSCNCAKSL